MPEIKDVVDVKARKKRNVREGYHKEEKNGFRFIMKMILVGFRIKSRIRY